jgi:hypothetical protein
MNTPRCLLDAVLMVQMPEIEILSKIAATIFYHLLLDFTPPIR